MLSLIDPEHLRGDDIVRLKDKVPCPNCSTPMERLKAGHDLCPKCYHRQAVPSKHQRKPK